MVDLEAPESIELDSPNIVKTYHKSPYGAISPLRPELSQEGRTVLITGASAEIGLSIARAYAEASAATIILTGRRKDTVQNAAAKLSSDFKHTKFVARVCDVGSVAESTALWVDLRTDGVIVDVLMLNAAQFGGLGSIVDSGFATIWSQYETNVRSLLQSPKRCTSKRIPKTGRRYYVVYVSTAAIYSKSVAAVLPTYALTKASGHLVMQKIAGEVDPKKFQMINFHPGTILSEASRSAGLDENSQHWDDDNLPAHFAVWATSAEAAVLHGRFVWAAWDVNEILSGDIKKSVESDPDFLTLSFVGV
ncbi:hypothetical protein BKA61DRAFT_713100 [Leptodontidium sp. MPI-SDFR-AT-0119]|nr:hypothetical protein BKA61DRAFT_713100 [Leptodontidium sp. MPI-SDFR-AT-0119]